MYNVVQYIASLYPAGPQRARFQEAAQTFRMPYWDWAAMPPNNQSVLPFSVGGEPDIMADGPNGLQLIANPLFTYTFKPLDPSIFPDFPVSFLHLSEFDDDMSNECSVFRMEQHKAGSYPSK